MNSPSIAARCRLIGLAVFATGIIPNTEAGESWDDTNGKDASSVLGQPDFDSSDLQAAAADTFFTPSGIAIDPVTGKLFVVDFDYNRVLRFASVAALTNGAAAEAVLGQADFGDSAQSTSRTGLLAPGGATVDREGRLWVADQGNNRVLRFDGASRKANGAPADGVLGQDDFETNGSGLADNRMNLPSSVAVDDQGCLWVADLFNNRVLRFDQAALKFNGAPADAVLGQPDFVTQTAATSQSGMSRPRGVAVDREGRLWVCDRDNKRVLRFDDAASKADGALANGVLGQVDFITSSNVTSRSILGGQPLDLDVDATGTLWVVDVGDHRVLRFDSAATKADGDAANGVLGQPDFVSDAPVVSRGGLSFPFAVAVDGTGRLWVGDTAGHRVLRYDAERFQPDGRIGIRAGNLKGNGIYNQNGRRQIVASRLTRSRNARVFCAVENDGTLPDDFRVTAWPGNRKVRVAWIQLTGGPTNVTATITLAGSGLSVVGAPAGSQTRFRADIRIPGRRASRTLSLKAISTTDGETDLVKVLVKKKP